MARDADAYADMLRRLLPPGQAWSRDPDSFMGLVTAGLAQEFARLDAAGETLVSEADPRTAVQLLGEWERVCGLPDPCSGPEPTLQARQQRVVAQLTQLGGQSRAYFIAVALALGYVVTITEFIGDADPTKWFTWRVNAPTVTINVLTCRGLCNEPLRWWGNAVLECVINRLKAAHTTVLFAYS